MPNAPTAVGAPMDPEDEDAIVAEIRHRGYQALAQGLTNLLEYRLEMELRAWRYHLDWQDFKRWQADKQA